MKQNKWLQFITTLFSILVQIGLFLLVLTNVHTSEGTPFDTSTLLQILPSYVLVILVMLTLGGIVYGGYYLKKHKQSWLVYIRENIINPLHKGLVIGNCIQMVNICLLFATFIFKLQPEKLRPQLDLLLNVSGITFLITCLSCIILEICFIDKESAVFFDKGCLQE